MSVLNQSVKKVIDAILVGGDVTVQTDDGTSTVPVVDLQALLEQERAGKNRKTLVKWLEKQGAQSSEPSEEESEDVTNIDASSPLEPVYEAPKTSVPAIDFIDGGEMAISELIDVLCQKRDSWQRSASCGLENIRVHLAEIKITVR